MQSVLAGVVSQAFPSDLGKPFISPGAAISTHGTYSSGAPERHVWEGLQLHHPQGTPQDCWVLGRWGPAAPFSCMALGKPLVFVDGPANLQVLLCQRNSYRLHLYLRLHPSPLLTQGSRVGPCIATWKLLPGQVCFGFLKIVRALPSASAQGSRHSHSAPPWAHPDQPPPWRQNHILPGAVWLLFLFCRPGPGRVQPGRSRLPKAMGGPWERPKLLLGQRGSLLGSVEAATLTPIPALSQGGRSASVFLGTPSGTPPPPPFYSVGLPRRTGRVWCGPENRVCNQDPAESTTPTSLEPGLLGLHLDAPHGAPSTPQKRVGAPLCVESVATLP